MDSSRIRGCWNKHGHLQPIWTFLNSFLQKMSCTLGLKIKKNVSLPDSVLDMCHPILRLFYSHSSILPWVLRRLPLPWSHPLALFSLDSSWPPAYVFQLTWCCKGCSAAGSQRLSWIQTRNTTRPSSQNSSFTLSRSHGHEPLNYYPHAKHVT